MSSRLDFVNEIVARPTPEALYAGCIDCNGTTQNMVLRRLSREQLESLLAYAKTQPHMIFGNCNGIAFDASLALKTRFGIEVDAR